MIPYFKILFLFLEWLSNTELQEIADNLNLDESDLEENLIDDDDEWDEWDIPSDSEALGANQDEMLVESDDEGGYCNLEGDVENSSDEDLPLVYLIPREKKENG